MTLRTLVGTRVWMALILAVVPLLAHADAFLPTMISANVLWVLALPLVVAVEGWVMTRWQWQQPHKNALKGNLLSMLAALPIGVGLSILGRYLSSTVLKLPSPSSQNPAGGCWPRHFFTASCRRPPTVSLTGLVGRGSTWQHFSS